MSVTFYLTGNSSFKSYWPSWGGRSWVRTRSGSIIF